jgi:hypothetical protein
MAHRRFTDSNGLQWEAYDVVSSPGLGRPGEPQLAPHSEVFRAVRTWLMFESASARKRLPSIPDDWERATEAELQRLLALATPITKDSR